MSRPPDEPLDPEGETVIDPEWQPGPDHHVLVEEEREAAPPPRPPRPTLWPWLLGLLVLVLAGIGAAFYLSARRRGAVRDAHDHTADDGSTTTTGTTTSARRSATTQATTAVATTQVPDLVGAQSAEAQETLREAGLRANVQTVPSAQPGGTVVAQNPAAGTEVDEGSAVRLNVSAGGTPPAPPEPATVPDVVGLQQTEAVRVAAAGRPEGIRAARALAGAGRHSSSRRPASPARAWNAATPSRSTSRRARIRRRATAVPDVVGLGEEEARDELRAAGFRVQVVKVDAPTPAEEGRVVDQQPSDEAPGGWEVTLTVGRLGG